MKKITLLAAFIIQSIALQSFSQDTLQENNFPVKSSGKRVTLDLSGNLSLNNYQKWYYDSYYEWENSSSNLDALLNLSLWKYGNKINYLGILSVNNEYTYSHRKDNEYEDKKKIRNYLSGKIYASAEYYIEPRRFFINASYGSNFDYTYNYQYDKDLNASTYEASYFSNYYFLWVSAGWGRLINKARLVKLGNFEKILREEKTELNGSVKQKLFAMIEKRNNKDYLEKYKDDADIIFMRDIEELLLTSGVILKPLSAETVMKLYRTLVNDKYVYYPAFTGYQAQLEHQFQIEGGYYRKSYMTLSGAYGFSPLRKTSILASAYISMPTNEFSSDYHLFISGIRNPFVNQLPVLAELNGFDNYLSSLYGFGKGPAGNNHLLYTAGLKLNAFISFSSFAGIQFWALGVVSKPKETGFRNTSSLGFEADYSILSIVNLRLGFEWIRNNAGLQSFNASLGTGLIIY